MNQENKKYSAVVLVAVILAAGLIASTLIAVNGLLEIKGNRTITVVGSAKQQIKSDLIEWKGSFSCQSQLMHEAYAKLKSDSDKVKKYLQEKGIGENDMVFSSIDTSPIYEVNYNGQYTNNVIGYRLHQRVELSSTDVDKISRLAREATNSLMRA